MSLQRCILLISEEMKTVQGFEVTTLTGFPKRLFVLAAKLYKRMLVRSRTHCVVDLMKLRSISLYWSLHQPLLSQGFEGSRFALIWTIQEMPQYLHHQLVSAIIFLSQMQSFPTSRCQKSRKPNRPRGPDIAYMDSIQMLPDTGGLKTKSPTFEKECGVKGSVDR